MLGWLVVNGFIESKKFNELYTFLQNAANKVNIDLYVKNTCDLLCTIDEQFQNYELPDFVLFWDKDIYLAKRLEAIGLKVYNSARAIEICDNKILTGITLNGKVKTPKTIIAPKTFEGLNYTKRDFVDHAMQRLGCTMIIKEAYGSFGQQVYLVHNLKEANIVIDSLGHKDFIMQEFIDTSIGKDVRINVVGEKVVSSMLRYNDNDFRSNISNGGSMKPYVTNSRIDDIAISACKAIGLDFAGVDVLFGKNDEYIVCEVNSNPHFKSSFECTGIDMSIEIMEYIKRYFTRQGICYMTPREYVETNGLLMN